MPERLVLCGGAQRAADEPPLKLATHGPDQNITLKLEDISRRMVKQVPDFLVDLLEIAAYVYSADRATSRGGDAQVGMGRDWRRTFRFVIPVREPKRWKDPKVLNWLRSTLLFLSEDNCTFEFERARNPPPYPEYFDFGNDHGRADEVVLFSGGLDSLGGALEELSKGHRVALVSHRSATRIFEDQRRLVTALRARFPQQVVHVPVLLNIHFRDAEITQRTRSFLYASMACVVAHLFGKNRIRFFENGVMSINLPISEQLVGSRASRTTHPQALHHFQQLFTALFKNPLRIENSFIWKTRRDVVQSILDNGGEPLIADAISCSRRRNLPKPYTHCGCCVQCIDRRFAVLAAGAAAHDPVDAYKVELFAGPRDAPKDRTVAESYVRVHARLRDITEFAFFDSYGGETARVLTALQNSAEEIGFRVLNLYRRHGQTVVAVLKEAVERHSEQLVTNSLPSSSLLVMAVSPLGPEIDLTKNAAQQWLEEVELEGEDESEAPALARRQPVLERAKAAVATLYSGRVPDQTSVPNKALCHAVNSRLKQTGFGPASKDTILRAAGRRK